MKLNKDQRDIVEDTDGKTVVLACPGSGKTFCMTHRVSYILNQKLAHPQEIMVVTFTNKAAREIKERIVKLTSCHPNRLFIGTFHGLSLRLLGKYKHQALIPQNFTIADDNDQLKVIKPIVEKYASYLDPGKVLSNITSYKNKLLRPENMVASSQAEAIMLTMYTEYQNALRTSRLLDFDDIIIECINLLRTNSEVLQEVQERFKYVIVDEGQDSNLCNMEFVRLISGKHNNLTIVGDTDQSIYAFRNSDLNLIVNFCNEPGVKIKYLATNYRSTPEIIDAANKLIKKNKKRIDKEIVPHQTAGHRVIIQDASSDRYEAGYVIQQITELCHVQGYNYSDIAIIYRNHSLARIFEEGFRCNFIPYTVMNGQSFFDKKEVKDVVAYLRFLSNPYDKIALMRAIASPKRGVGDTSLEKICDFAAEQHCSFIELVERIDEIPKLQKKAKESFTSFISIIKSYTTNIQESENLKDTILKFLHEIGYIESISTEKERIENVYALIDMYQDIQDTADDVEGINNFVQLLSLCNDMLLNEETDVGVKLITAHSAKGMEFPVVFVVGVEENIFPSRQSIHNASALEEERRLFYVAMTRAQKILYITHANKRITFSDVQYNKPSRFISELLQA